LKPEAEVIYKLLPEIEMIKQDELREKVAAVWADAIDLGGWKPDDLDAIPFTLLIPECDISLILHTRTVTRTAVNIAETLKSHYGDAITIDTDILVAGGILHDVGKVLEYAREGDSVVKSAKGKLLRHPFSGQALAYKHGLPFEVLHMIAYHSKEGDLGKRTTEGIIVHHADFVNFEPLRG
jgi:putative nucleotidyltransferase with HDIG domain